MHLLCSVLFFSVIQSLLTHDQGWKLHHQLSSKDSIFVQNSLSAFPFIILSPISWQVKVQRQGSQSLQALPPLIGSRWPRPYLRGETHPLHPLLPGTDFTVRQSSLKVCSVLLSRHWRHYWWWPDDNLCKKKRNCKLIWSITVVVSTVLSHLMLYRKRTR